MQQAQYSLGTQNSPSDWRYNLNYGNGKTTKRLEPKTCALSSEVALSIIAQVKKYKINVLTFQEVKRREITQQEIDVLRAKTKFFNVWLNNVYALNGEKDDSVKN